MRYRKLSDDDDYVFGGGQLDFYRDVPEAPGQAVKTRLLLWLGEWFLNIDEGTPYLIGILGKHSQETADLILQDRALQTTGVIGITDFESSFHPDTRLFSATFTVNTIYGPTDVDLANYINY